ncbi:TetR family transcriptional regulator [Rhodococcus sp. SRB_17]|uniref:TetR/AcrR family transcriptional regulator n=1 Tax=Rhodococcus sp. OK302 TaxID=1882769 RepID=UPI000B93E308|nr:TetR/AcrR family transcriptional regulator [Rhodococcus sp. OK302]NMM84463.1 TetR family transcriptional regulator [Rhodococcus sp. SRB_17]OYD66612.1 TetR family transcriptional regulator [Rhodococcus sp. OK302]
MARLTRQQAQAQTRETLLVTAVEHFLERGYAAASLDQIAEDAGYSKGAVYSNFKNKDELCAEVLGRIRLTKVGEITEQLGAGSSVDDAISEFAVWAERTIGDQRWTLLEVEYSVRSRHSDEIREKIASGAEQVRVLIAGVVRHLTEVNGVKPSIDPDVAALRILSVGIGLGLQRAISPELAVDPLVDTVREILLPR